MGMRGFLWTVGLGASAMYFFDPQLGNRRRALLRDQVTHLSHEADRTADVVWGKGRVDLRNRLQGVQHRAGSAFATTLRGAQGDGQEMAPAYRLLTTGGGGLLALYGMIRGGLVGKAASLFGLNLVSRGLLGKPLPELIRSTTSNDGLDPSL